MKNKPFFLIIVIVLTLVSLYSVLIALPSVQPLPDGRYKYTFYDGPGHDVVDPATGRVTRVCDGNNSSIICVEVIAIAQRKVLPKGSKIDIWNNDNSGNQYGYINCTLKDDFNTETGEHLNYSKDDSKPVFTNYNEWLNATK